MSVDLSIIVPAFNEAAYIKGCIDAIKTNLDGCGLLYEIIVVDNGSEDKTAEIALRYMDKVRVVRLDRDTISKARNSGAQLAHGALLAFIDADVLVTPDWARGLKRIIEDADLQTSDYFGGYPYHVRDQASIMESAWFDAIDRERQSYLSGGNIVISAGLMAKSGGFDEKLITGEDYEFCVRLQDKHRATLCLSRDFRVIHLGFPSRIGPFFRRESWHGMGDFQSFTNFLSSKVALVSAVFVLSVVMALCALLIDISSLSLFLIGVHLVLPLLLVFYKFRLRKFRYVGVQYYLCYLYLWARFVALFRVLAAK